jgi:methionyl-tRNA formyltransferase
VSQTLRLLFAGTPEFAVPSFEAARQSGHELVGVWTQPDRPAGRGRQRAASPIKQAALAAHIPVFQPDTLRTAAARAEMAALKPDLLIVVAYGLILPPKILALPRLGCWNVHASLLPRWRGAAPIARAIEAGDRATGICLMKMESGLDTGPVILREVVEIEPFENAQSLHDRLARIGARVLADGLALLRGGLTPQPLPQSQVGISYAHKLEKSEALLDLTRPAIELDRAIRAYVPWPVAELELAGERVRVHAADLIPGDSSEPPGRVITADREGIVLNTGQGLLRLTQVQRAGGKPIAAGDYVNARPELRRGGA